MDLYLSKSSAQLLGSSLSEKNLLAPGTTYAWYRQREEQLRCFFHEHRDLVFCDDVNGLVQAMGMEYKSPDWRLFLDSSCRSLKAVLLYNGNSVASVPIAHSVHMNETYGNFHHLRSYWQPSDTKLSLIHI